MLFHRLAAVGLMLSLVADRPYAADNTSQQVKLYDEGVMLRIPVNAFGQTLFFLLDTGCTLSVIDARFQPYLGKSAGTFSAETPLEMMNHQAIYVCPKVSIAGRSLGLANVTSLDLQMPRLISGQPCDGILGMDFFATNIVQIDFDRQTVSLFAAVPDEVRKTYVAVPLKQSSGRYWVKVLANHGQPVDLLVDIGDNSSIALDSETWQKLFSGGEGNTFTATVADVGNQTAQSKIGILDKLAVESLAYTNLHAIYIRNADDHSHLGLGFFRRHTVVFDFPDRMIYLEPGQRFAIPDKEDMSGLHLLREGENTIVYSVDENSPAAAQGIKPQDVIDSVNGQKASTLTMWAIRRLLKSRDGDKVTLQLKRGDVALQIELTLKQTL